MAMMVMMMKTCNWRCMDGSEKKMGKVKEMKEVQRVREVGRMGLKRWVEGVGDQG